MYDRPFPPPCRLWSVISILDLVVKRTPGMYANVCGFAWTAACLNPNGWKIPKTQTPKCQRNVVRGRCARSMLALRSHLFFVRVSPAPQNACSALLQALIYANKTPPITAPITNSSPAARPFAGKAAFVWRLPVGCDEVGPDSAGAPTTVV